MTKRIRIIAVLLMMVLVTTACSTRKTTTLEKFQKVCETEHMLEIDAAEMTEGFEGVTQAYAAKMTGNDLSAAFVTFESEEAALAAYNQMADSLAPAEGYKDTLEGSNFHAVVNNTFAVYTRVIHVDDQLWIFTGSVTYKAEIDKIISQFGHFPVSAV